MTAPGPEFVRVGPVTRSHGLKGEVVVDVAAGMQAALAGVAALWTFPEDAEGGAEPRRLDLAKVQAVGRRLVFRFEGIRKREQGDLLRGEVLWARRDDLALGEGEVPVDELLGARVRLEDGTELGALEDILRTGANDVYVVRGAQGEWLLPATDQVVLRVEPESKSVTVRLLPGMAPSSPAPPAGGAE